MRQCWGSAIGGELSEIARLALSRCSSRPTFGFVTTAKNLFFSIF